MTTCQCGKPTAGAVLCGGCGKTLAMAAEKIRIYFYELDTVAGKSARFGEGVGSRTVGREQPLPIDGRFAGDTADGTALRDATRNTVSTWARIVMDGWAEIEGPVCQHCSHESCVERVRRTWPTDSVGSVCAYLARMAPRVATADWAPEILDELTYLETKLCQFVDRPRERWYAGVCGSVTEPVRQHDGTTCACACHNGDGYACDMPGGCGLDVVATEPVTCTRELWAEPGQYEVRCRDCGTEWPVAERRRLLLAEAEDRVATIAAIARIVGTLGDRDVRTDRLEQRIRKWGHRGRIKQAGERYIDGRLRPTYRVGDVLELLRN